MKQNNTSSKHRIIYAIYTITLMLIDWTRGSQVGSTWAWTVNMLGVVLCLFLITADGIKNFMKKKYVLWTVIMTVVLLGGYYLWTLLPAVIYRGKLLTAICNVWMIGACFMRLFEKNVKSILENWKYASKFALGGALLLLFMFLSVNEDFWPVWFMLLFILVYSLQIEQNEKKTIIDGIVDGIMISFFMLQGAAFVFRPFDDPDYRYPGIYSNTNMNALFYAIILIAFLYRLYRLRKGNKAIWRRILCFLFGAAMIGFSILTVCKTAWVAEAFCLLLYVVLADIRALKMKASQVVLRIALYGLVVMISVPIAYLPIRYLPPVFHHPIWYEGEYSESKVHSWDPVDSPKYVSFDEVMGAVSSRLKPIVDKLFASETYITSVYAEEIRDHNGIHVGPWFFPFEDEFTLTYSSYLGRAATWYYYTVNGKIMGHSNADGHHTGMGASYTWHAQNVFLQIWYYYGIPAGILFLIISWGTWGLSIRKSWKDDEEWKNGAIFVAMYLSLFLLFGLFEAVWYPGQMILTLAVFGPKLMMKDKDIHEEISNSSL